MNRIRLKVQLLFTIITNGYLYGFLNGKIYRGGLKYACVPGLNCYSCPGAVASCPIGALQALLNQRGFQVPFAALGFFFLFGSLLGRFVCGWLCPFGLVQDLLHKIPIFKKRKRLPHHHILKYGKYAVLILLVLAGSMFLWSGFAKIPAFCKFLCPSGTLPGGRAVPVEAGGSAGYRPAVYQGLPSFLPVSVPLGGHLRLVQPVQPGTDSLGTGAVHLLQGLRKGLPGGLVPPGDFPLPGVHPLREMRGCLPRAMPALCRWPPSWV